MPPQYIFDLSKIDLNGIFFDQEGVRLCNPQRGDMEMLNAIIWADGEKGQILGYKDIGEKEFWVAGHIPGRPLFPGVLMIELGAQLASFYMRKYMGWKGFIGFGGVEDVKFRQQVQPGCRMLILGQKTWERHHRVGCRVQGVVDGNLCFEGTIIGVEF